MRISLISAACLLVLGCGPGTTHANVSPSSACQDVAAADTPGVRGSVKGALFIDAKAFAVTTPENVADVARALDALVQASRECSAGHLQEHA